MDSKRLLLAMVLAVGFMFFWSLVVVPRITPKPPAVPEAPAGVPNVSPVQTPAAMVPAHAATGKMANSPEAFLRDDRNEVVLSARGGAAHDWRIKIKGQEVDLVKSPDSETLPLATFPDHIFTIAQRDHQALMQSTLNEGLRFTKTLTLSPSGFLHTLTFRFDNPTGTPLDLKNWEWGWGPGLDTTPTEEKENPRLTRSLYVLKERAHVLKPGDYAECGRWCGIDNRYFLVAIVPPADHQPAVTVTGAKDQTRIALRENVTIPAHGTTSLAYQIYVGPKGYTHLKEYGKGLEEAVDFGTFSALGKIILSAIYRLQGWTKNFGWAIVLLTIALQLLLTPLTLKSLKATLAMKKIQPKMQELQKKYKSDPKRLNVEMMNLYKSSGTNPFGGCLPMLLQLPIFWALFTTLRNAYELRGAPWILWIHDLSAADPYKILPIVMGVAMYFQQRMSGISTDPTQRQMMIMMPIIFTIMFMNFPAGLVLYWLTNNLLTMLTQFVFLRYQNQQVEIIPPR